MSAWRDHLHTAIVALARSRSPLTFASGAAHYLAAWNSAYRSVLIKGDETKIARLRTDEMFVKMIVGVQLVHAKVGVVGGYCGAEMQSLLRVWDEQEHRLL